MPTGTTYEEVEEQNNTVQQAPKGTQEAVFGTGQPTTEQKQSVSTDVQQPTPTTSTDTEKPGPGTSTDYSQDLIGYDDQIATLQKERQRYEQSMETPEQQAKREKKEKAQRKIAAIGDGIRALSNLYFTTKYAPNMYNHEKDNTYDKIDARQQKLKAERDADRDKYLNYSLKIGDLQNERAKTARELEAEAERMRIARQKAQQEADEHKWKETLQPDIQRKAAADADAAGYKATTAKAEADNAPALQAAKLNTEQQRGKTEQTKQVSNRAAAAAHGRSNVGDFYAYDENGREHTFETKAAADNYARQHGTFQEEDETEKTVTNKTDRRGKNEKSTATKTTTGGYARKPAAGDNTPPSRRKSNDNTPPSRRK